VYCTVAHEHGNQEYSTVHPVCSIYGIPSSLWQVASIAVLYERLLTVTPN